MRPLRQVAQDICLIMQSEHYVLSWVVSPICIRVLRFVLCFARFQKQGSGSDIEALAADVAKDLKAFEMPPPALSPFRPLRRHVSDPSRFVSSPSRTQASYFVRLFAFVMFL